MTIMLKKLREEKKMSQEELAKESGVSRVTISQIESGTRKNVKTDTLTQLAIALNVTAQELCSFF